MARFQTSDLQRFFNQGENEVSSESPFLVDRYEIATTVDVSTYTLPDYVVSIRRVTWLGWKLDPLPNRNFREVFQSSPQEGQPFWYIYNNIGQNQIQLFPSPNAALAAPGNPWTQADIQNCCIVEFYRATDNATFVLPPWSKRQMLKFYVAKRAYQIDGAGVNQKLAKFYSQMWDASKAGFVDTLNYLYTAPRKFMLQEIVGSNYFPGQPVLPVAQFGEGVDTGY
jgi:hypothetical protein